MWDQVHMFLYSFVPFFFMVTSNILLAKRLLATSHNIGNSLNKSSLRKKKSVSVFCILFSFMFIVCTLPQKICYGYLYDILNKSSGKWYGPIILRLTDELNFSFTGLNFIFQLALNNMFRSEFLILIKRVFRRAQVGPIPAVSRTTRNSANWTRA